MKAVSTDLLTIPSQIRVGPYVLQVMRWNANEAAAASADGRTLFREQVLQIREDLHINQAANTFLHEVLHAIHWVHGLDDEDNEEDFANLTANGLCAFWRDNPQAMRWFEAALHA